MKSQHINSTTDLQNYMLACGKRAREAAAELRLADTDIKSQALKFMATEIQKNSSAILKANKTDMDAAISKGLSEAMCDRLKLDRGRIDSIAVGLESIAALPEPVGSIDETWTQPNGLKFSKVRIPIGVIGMIFESRPNVTADAGALCVKSGNACILRGGSESKNSNQSIHTALVAGLEKAGLPGDAIQLVATTDRTAVGELLGGLNGSVDLIIPRGGKSLIARVQSDARIPILAHLEGLCHTYIHQEANETMALDVILNAKMRRTGVCGSTETVLIDSIIAPTILPKLAEKLQQSGCEIRGCKASQLLSQHIIPAADNDYYTEHLAAIINMRIVKGIDEALTHIATYGSGHTDSIITDSDKAAKRFLRDIDSAICMHNASTQFADGGEFGFGAEIGIATGRLHARGPVGAQHLTTYKYTVQGDGHIRP